MTDGQEMRWAHDNLNYVRNALGAERWNLGYVLEHMRTALNWAVASWFVARGEMRYSSFPQQQVRFLNVAPKALQEEYLRLANSITHLAVNLGDTIATDQIQDVAMQAPALAAWREQAKNWLNDAHMLVVTLTDAGKSLPYPGSRRVGYGRLRGSFAGLTPCLILARTDTHREIRGNRILPQGYFQFKAPATCYQSISQYAGFILPLILCRDRGLGELISNFARFLRQSWSIRKPYDEETSSSVERQGWRRQLQTWLEDNGLSAIRIVDKDPVDRWSQVQFTPKITQLVLREFDYVTMVEDNPDEAIKIIGHEPFRWTSHGDLLDYCHTLAEDEELIAPFRLFIVSEISGFPCLHAGRRERQNLFHPPEYWSHYTRPIPGLPLNRVLVRIEQNRLILTLGEQTVDIPISSDYDLFPGLLEWLRLLEIGDLPLAIDLETELGIIRLIAHDHEDDCFLIAIIDSGEIAVLASGIVERVSWIESFHHELLDFLNHRLDTGEWLWDDDEENQAEYLTGLLQHPFLASRV